MSSKAGNTVLAVLAGAAIGAGIGILFAPDKGSKTRGKIKDGFDQSKSDLKDKFNDLTDMLKHKAARTKKDLESTFDDLVANVDNKTEDVIATLEKKLEELKKHSAKIQK
ncbi:YtxH domain-containing protein [Flavobacterium sp. '19STA2R22 D10 B1']|uniref:YtxH domain-containing protein n=1 Tax=Flavobacterium aerium TaxID=3037261 RepID=UPI00278C283C|nr:YtxH domain-containing protein [Flavobacterium sp. '19STA2R22 D10 B1']